MATIDSYKIKVDVDGINNVKKLSDEAVIADKNLQKLDASANKVAKQGLDALGRGADRVATIVGGALALIGGSAVRMADQLSDVAASTGFALGEVYQLSAAVEQAGGQFADAGRLIIEFYKTLDEAIGGSVKSQEALTKLGITFDDLKNKTQQEIFYKAIEGLAKLDKGAERTALGLQAFGKAFSTIDPDVLDDLIKKGDFEGIQVEMKKAADFVGQLERTFRTLQVAALQVLAPIIDKLKDLRLTASQAETIIKLMSAALIGAVAVKTIQGFVALAEGIKLVAAAAKLLARNPILLAMASATLLAGYLAFGDQLKTIIKDLTTIGDMPEPGTPMAGDKKGQTGKTDEEYRIEVLKLLEAEQKKLADEQGRSNSILMQQNQLAEQYQKTINGTIGLVEEEAKLIKIRADVERDSKNQIAEINRKIAAEQEKGAFTNTQLIEQYKAQRTEIERSAEATIELRSEEQKILETLQKQKDERKAATENSNFQRDVAYDVLQAEQMRKVIAGEITESQMNEALALEKLKVDSANRIAELQTQLQNASSNAEKARIQASIDLETQKANHAIAEAQRVNQEKALLENSYAAGVTKGLEQIADQFKPINMAQKAVADTWGTISNAVDTFVNTGKFKFSDFARSIVADLAKMIAKALIFRAISGFLGGLGIPLPPGLAEGGPAEKGKPYMVGERGPELFVPKSAGTVIPNDKLAMASASQPQQQQPVVNNYTYNNNINAVDAKSVAALFYENRKSLFGAANQARKELPYGAAA